MTYLYSYGQGYPQNKNVFVGNCSLLGRNFYNPHIPMAIRPFPKNDPTKMMSSAETLIDVNAQITLFIKKIAHSKPYAFKLRDAAQKSQTNQVERMIKEAGITYPFRTTYNPDRFDITIFSKSDDCCMITAGIKW